MLFLVGIASPDGCYSPAEDSQSIDGAVLPSQAYPLPNLQAHWSNHWSHHHRRLLTTGTDVGEYLAHSYPSALWFVWEGAWDVSPFTPCIKYSYTCTRNISSSTSNRYICRGKRVFNFRGNNKSSLIFQSTLACIHTTEVVYMHDQWVHSVWCSLESIICTTVVHVA